MGDGAILSLPVKALVAPRLIDVIANIVPIPTDIVVPKLPLLPPHHPHHNNSHRRRDRRLASDNWCASQPFTGNHTLSSDCSLLALVVVAVGTSLRLATDDAMLATHGPATIASSIRLFYVQGDLTLANLIVEGGKADYGAGILVQKAAGGDARAHLIGTVVQNCEATGAGGAALRPRCRVGSATACHRTVGPLCTWLP